MEFIAFCIQIYKLRYPLKATYGSFPIVHGDFLWLPLIATGTGKRIKSRGEPSHSQSDVVSKFL